MCGIAGWIGPDAGWNAETLRDGLRQRGPDGAGIWRGEGATLVHTRLAIVGLGEAGAQPMGFGEELKVEKQKAEIRAGAEPDSFPLSPFHFPNFSHVLVFNGEIYNFRALRAELETAGETFVGHSDTEVLLRLLSREGVACLTKLAGMFAFCFWDEAAGEALLARDAFGIKPLYYRIDNGTLAFASEARLLMREGDATDPDALRDFFLWGSVPEPATLSVNVRLLPAGHLLRWKDGNAEIRRWHSEKRSVAGGPLSLVSSGSSRTTDHRPPATDHWASVTREALLESMRRHLVADVPVGIFLSGGIDSTAVLALAREVLGQEADLRTFSIGFDDPEFDESGIARRTAQHFGTRHTEWRMTPDEGAAEISAFLAAADQPSIDGFNTWCVSKLARREGMKVVLSGLGGDEFFAGYGSFARVPRFYQLHRLLGPFRPVVAGMLARKPAGSPWRRLGSFLSGDGSWLSAFHAQRGIFTPEEAAHLTEALIRQRPVDRPFDGFDASSTDSGQPTTDRMARRPREIVSQLEITRYMRNQLLRDSDVFSMAHGLELRVPFVDARLAEALDGIPPEIRLRQGKKLLLAAVPEVPEWVWNQPKRGFRFPFQQWMEGNFGELMDEAKRRSSVSLNAWYRTWAVAAALRALDATVSPKG